MRLRKIIMKTFIVLAVILVLWLIMAQSCMFMRTTNADASKKFTSRNIKYAIKDFKSGNRTIHYVQTGNDTLPTLFFIHGSPGSWDAFDGYLSDSLLLPQYRMISIDRPGFGYSDFGKAMNMQDETDLISRLLKNIDNKKPVVLIGHSLGGPVVVKLAAENPGADIKYLVILAGSVDPAEENPENWRIPLDHTFLRFLIPGALRPSNTELLLFKQDVYGLQNDFPKVTCDVIIMQGDKDMLVPPGNSVYAQKQLTNAKTIEMTWFKGENHFIPWTKYNDIRDKLLSLAAKMQ